jgi:sigma-B regulation protein RsbU (phosphoserine phosphatase)
MSPAGQVELSQRTADFNQSGRKILLIDDDTIVRESIAAYLEDSGFNVTEAEDGQKGFNLFLNEQPGLVICDLRMPKLDGLSLLRKISEKQPNIPVPVIVISGAGGMSDVVEALRMGASDYIVKPIVDMKVLEHAIEHCLERVTLQIQNEKYKQQLEATNRELKESLKLLEQDQRAGLQLQLKMFPQEPLVLENYRIDYKLIPSLYLSGDFLEYAEYRDDMIGFYLADVSGHGSSSAFVTALLHHLSVTMIRRLEKNAKLEAKPSEILSYFNRELLAVGMDKYVTMFIGMINAKTGELVYSVAGHLPMPILVYANEQGENDARYLEGTGMPLGIVPDVEYYNYSTLLPESFSLCMFSDGILEVLPASGLLQQEECLLNLIRDKNESLEKITATLKLDELNEVPDDIAIMTITKKIPSRTLKK